GAPPTEPARVPYTPAAAIIAALSVHSSRGGIVSRARPPTSSAARLRRRVLAATPPATTTSPYGAARARHDYLPVRLRAERHVQLFEKGLHDRSLKRGGQVRPVLIGEGAAQV